MNMSEPPPASSSPPRDESPAGPPPALLEGGAPARGAPPKAEVPDPGLSFLQSLGEKVPTPPLSSDEIRSDPKPYVPTWNERLEESRVYIGPAFVALFVIVLAGWYVGFHALPRQAEQKRKVAQAPAMLAAQQKLAEGVLVWEELYRSSASSGVEDEALQSALNALIERQREVLRQSTFDEAEPHRQLAQLERWRDSIQARQSAARSLALEREAEQALQAGDTALRMRKLSEALQLRRAANASASSEAERDALSSTRLETMIADAAAGPLHAAAVAARERAMVLRTLEPPEEALKALREERDARAEINRRFPASRFTDPAALERLDEEIAAIASAELVARIAAREAQGNQAVAADSFEAAATAFSAAAMFQRELNASYPKSRFVSLARVDELETRRQTALSSPQVAQIVALDRDVAAALRTGRVEGAPERLSTAMNLLAQVATQYPRSQSVADQLRKRIAYLWLKRDELGGLREEVRSRLVALPGRAEFEFYATEVPQALYERVMNVNPSRHSGPALPVESVTWAEAGEFCRRLSWVLGYKVRLPFEEEWVQLFAGRGAEAWSAENSNGRTHSVGSAAVGAAGLRDVAGNVAEWLQRTSDAGVTAPVGGGSFIDERAAIERMPVGPVNKRERSRHIGFRFVVERGETAAR